jgi:hypothetical protein
VIQAFPSRRCPDRIDDDAKPPEDSFVPPDGTRLDVHDSPRAGDQPTVIVCARVGQAFPPGPVHRPDTNRQRRCALRSDDTEARKTAVARFGRSHEWR